jgi:hypothetical protein
VRPRHLNPATTAAAARASAVSTTSGVRSAIDLAGEASAAAGSSAGELVDAGPANATRSSAGDVAGDDVGGWGLDDGGTDGEGAGVVAAVGLGLGVGLGFAVDGGFGFVAGALTVVVATGWTDTHLPSQAIRTLP